MSSVRRWHSQQDAARDTDRVRTSSVGERVAARAAERKHGTQTKPAAPAAKQSCGEVEGRAEGESEEDDEEDEDGSAYALVVKESKAQEKGSQFELPCGSSVVVGRSQSRAGIVIKDELVSHTQQAHLLAIMRSSNRIRSLWPPPFRRVRSLALLDDF